MTFFVLIKELEKYNELLKVKVKILKCLLSILI